MIKNKSVIHNLIKIKIEITEILATDLTIFSWAHQSFKILDSYNGGIGQNFQKRLFDSSNEIVQ